MTYAVAHHLGGGGAKIFGFIFLELTYHPVNIHLMPNIGKALLLL